MSYMEVNNETTAVVIKSGIVSSDEDIDLGEVVDFIRIERLSEDSIWFAGYGDEQEDLDYNFWLSSNNGLSIRYEITTQVPKSIFPVEDWGEEVDEGLKCSKCDWTGPETDNLISHYAVDHEGMHEDVVDKYIDIDPEDIDI